MNPFEFRGASLDDLRDFPQPAMREVGYQIDRVQNGLAPDDFKSMATIGAGVMELRIEDTPQQAASMRARSELMMALTEVIRERGMIQGDAAALFGATQPRMSDLMRGKINLFSLDTLIDMAATAGMSPTVKVS